MKNNTIGAKPLNSQVAIDNALGNGTLKTAIITFGHDGARLNKGNASPNALQRGEDSVLQKGGGGLRTVPRLRFTYGSPPVF